MTQRQKIQLFEDKKVRVVWEHLIALSLGTSIGE